MIKRQVMDDPNPTCVNKLRQLVLLLLILFLAAGKLFSQHEDDNRFTRPEYITVNINKPKEKIAPGISFTALQVYDRRPDTSQIGLMYTSRPDVVLFKSVNQFPEEVKYFYQLLLGQPVNPAIAGELHCFIRRFALSDLITMPMNDQEKKEGSGKFDNKEESGATIRMEFYLKKDNYYIPAWRFDSICTGSKRVYGDGGRYIAEALTASFRKTGTLNWEKLLANGKRLSWTEISDHYQQSIDFPILRDTPKKGVYLSFEDFRNNKVSPADFTVSHDKKGDFLYLKDQKGEEVLFTDCWGYSDGKDVFIYSSSNFFKLYRRGNGYLFFGAKEYARKRVMRLNFRVIDAVNPNSTYSKARTSTKFELDKDYLQLDMSSGDIY